MPRKRAEKPATPVVDPTQRRRYEDEPSPFLAPVDIDKLTGMHMAQLHVGRIWNHGDVGEQELVLQLFHLLHARKYSLNPNDIDARRADFEEQMKLVFEGS